MSPAAQSTEFFLTISPGSVILAMLILNFAMMLGCFLRRSDKLLYALSSEPLLLLWLFAMARAFFPVEFSFARELPKPDWLTLSPITKELVWFWVGGSMIAAGYWGLRLLEESLDRESYQVTKSEQVDRLVEKIGLRNVKVLVSPDVNIPFVTGFFRPKIYLPALALSDQAMEWILQHELRHVRLRDPVIKAVYLLMMICFWWNPALYFFRPELDRVLELRCDASLTRSCDENDRHAYLGTLLDLIRRSNQKPQRQLLGSGLTSLSDAETIKQRFRVVMDHPMPSAKLVAVMTLVVMGAHFVSYAFTF